METIIYGVGKVLRANEEERNEARRGRPKCYEAKSECIGLCFVRTRADCQDGCLMYVSFRKTRERRRFEILGSLCEGNDRREKKVNMVMDCCGEGKIRLVVGGTTR